MERTLKVAYEHWGKYLPVNAAVGGQSASGTELPPYNRGSRARLRLVVAHTAAKPCRQRPCVLRPIFSRTSARGIRRHRYGVLPTVYDPLVDVLGYAKANTLLADVRTSLQHFVSQRLPHDAYLRELTSAR